MRKLLLNGAAVFALAAAPTAVFAQGSMATDTSGAAMPSQATAEAPVLTAEQQATYDAWAADLQSDYDAWPNEYKVYYWTLTPQQQKGYWALTPDQRGRIYDMTPEQRKLAWQSVVQQLAGQTPTTPPGQANPPGKGMPTKGVPAPQTASQDVPPAMPADESYQGGPYKGALTPPPASAMNKDYPVCSKDIQDSCRNPGSI
ncbi:MAG: hypothetical protein CMH85_02665 [Novosphingobium sp.]|nr:hypothetical protein [Novosphingobium sp.]|tara:strand:- start:200 stop:802 length:603 start_codon:yes stop_codon:yes gene_type:complete